MTSRVEADLQAQINTLLADNTGQNITAGDVRSVMTDLADSCFREPAYLLEDGSGRLLLESGDGYQLLDIGTPPASDITGAVHLYSLAEAGGAGIDLAGSAEYIFSANQVKVTDGPANSPTIIESDSGGTWYLQTGTTLSASSAGDFAFMGFARMNASAASQRDLFTITPNGSSFLLRFYLDSSNVIRLAGNPAGGSVAGPAVSAAELFAVGCSWDNTAGQFNFYLGRAGAASLVGTLSTTVTFSASSRLSVGITYTAINSGDTGIGLHGFYNRQLSLADFSAFYNAGAAVVPGDML